MKTCKILLCEWITAQHQACVDIPWPQVHQQVGAELIKWVHSHDLTKVQLVLSHSPRGLRRLYADFYNADLRAQFALLFAK